MVDIAVVCCYLFLGTKIYAIPDFAYMDGDTVHIWDWKTGKPGDDDLFQLYTYALYARAVGNVDDTVSTAAAVQVQFAGAGYLKCESLGGVVRPQRPGAT